MNQGQGGYPPARRGLVDAGDLAWLIDTALAGTPEEGQAWVPLLRGLFDPTNHDAQEAADRVRGTVLWPAFAFWFDPVVLGSEEAAVHTACSARALSALCSRRCRTRHRHGSPCRLDRRYGNRT